MTVKKVPLNNGTGLQELVDDSGEHKVRSVQLNFAEGIYAVNGEDLERPVPITEFLRFADISDDMKNAISEYASTLRGPVSERWQKAQEIPVSDSLSTITTNLGIKDGKQLPAVEARYERNENRVLLGFNVTSSDQANPIIEKMRQLLGEDNVSSHIMGGTLMITIPSRFYEKKLGGTLSTQTRQI